MKTDFPTQKIIKGFDKKKEKFERLPLRRFYTFSFFLNIFIIGLAFLARFILPPQIPLYYGLPQSSEQIVPASYLFLPSFMSLVFTILNAYVSIFVDNTYLKKVFAFSSILISILTAVTTLKIVFLVGNI